MIRNEMTDAERAEAFDSIKANVIDQILGNPNLPVENEIEKTAIDFKFGSGNSWMDNTRITSNLNNDMKGIGEYNDQFHANNGHMKMAS